MARADGNGGIERACRRLYNPRVVESIHHVQVYGADRDGLREAVRSDAALRTWECFLGPARGSWQAVYPRLILRGPKFAKNISRRLETHAFAVRMFQGAFLYEYYRNGVCRDRYSSAPAAVREATEMDSELDEIVQLWEMGKLTAAEYRERVDAYLSGFAGRAAEVKARARREACGMPPEEAAGKVREVVEEVFGGRNAGRLVREVIEEMFADEEARNRALRAARHEPQSGDPRAYQEILGPDGVEAARRALSGGAQDGLSILRAFARIMGFEGAELSFQKIQAEGLAGFEHVGG